MYQAVIRFFRDFLNQEPSALARVADFKGEVFLDNDVLVFSLEGLLGFLSDDRNIEYCEFRKMIYQSKLNEDLKSSGGHIEIHHSTGKVDDNLYKLVRIAPEVSEQVC